jgi:hypothetical protein
MKTKTTKPKTKTKQNEIYIIILFYCDTPLTLAQYVSGFTSKYYEEGGLLPVKFPLFVAVLTLVVTLYLQFGTLRGFVSNARITGFGLLASPFISWVLVDVYVPLSPLLSLLYPSLLSFSHFYSFINGVSDFSPTQMNMS